MLIRPLTTVEDCRKVAALERLVWGYPDAEDVVPPPVLIVSIKRGGLLERIELHDRANARHAQRSRDSAPGMLVQITASQDSCSTANSCNARISPTIRGG